MRPCEKCLENNWTFKPLDTGWVRATCKMCNYEVEWEPSVKPKIWKGANCKKCQKGIIEVKNLRFKPSKLRKNYYYTACYHCPKCDTDFYNERFKVINKDYLVPLPI